MKITKRIFIALLIVAVTVSTFALTAFAEESEGYDFGYVLEYFEEPTLFDYDFTKDDNSYQSSLLVKRPTKLTETLVRDDNDPAAGYLSLGIASSESFVDAYGDNNVYFNWSSADAIDDFIIKMTVAGAYGNGSESSLPIIVVAVSDVESTDAAAVGTTVLAIDYKANCIRYISAETAAEVSAPFELADDEWYNVSIVYDATSGIATITVADMNGNNVTIENATIPYSAIKNVRIGTHGTYYGNPRGTMMKFKEITAFGGKHDRDPSTVQSVIEDTIVEMYAAFGAEDITMAEQEAICEIATKISDYGFTTEDAEAATALAELSKGIVPFYNDKLVYCLDTYSTIANFADRRALVDASLAYVGALENIDLTGHELADEISVNTAGVKALDDELNISEQETIAFINAAKVIGEVDLYDYPTVQNYYNQLSVYTPDPTYEGAYDYYELYLDIATSYNNITAKSQKFINAINIANDTELNFNARAEAFIEAKGAYYDNTTFPGITEAIAIYNDIYSYMTTEIDKADSFIKNVNSADFADYVTAKQEFLNEAAKYADCQIEYKGVAEAQLLMVEVQKYIDEQIKNAKAYVDAVSALDYLRGDALLAGIKKAQDLQAAGNVLGVDGVAEANIKLNQLVSSMELEDKYRDHFISLVNSIDSVTDPKALFELLVDAKEAESFADPRAEGVFEASTKLEKAIESYNKKVNSANTAFETASEAAIYTCAIGKDVNPVADRILAIIKKFFEEE